MSADLKSLDIGEVQPVRTDDPLLCATKHLVKTPADGFARVYRRSGVYNDVFVKHVLVLRAA